MIKKINLRIKQWPWLSYFLVFSISFIIFLYVLTPPGIIGPDSFYHTKMALMMKQQGIIQDFPWLQFTTYKNLFVDHHFFYHLLLVPFINIPSPSNLDPLAMEIEPLIKTKLATAFFGALCFLFIFWFLKKIKAKIPFFWTSIGFFISWFLYRLSLTRAPALSIIILIMGIFAILKKRYFLLFCLSFLYVWTYGAWPLILIIVILYSLASLFEKISKQATMSFVSFKIALKSLFKAPNIKLGFSCLTGLLAGMIINPYFPKTFPFYWFQTFKIAVLNYSSKIPVGNEWYSPEINNFMISLFPLLILWLISMAWFIFTIKQQKKKHWFFLLLTMFFLAYTLKSRRNIEYLVPFMIFFNAVIFTQIIKKISWQKITNQLKSIFYSDQGIFYFLLISIISFVSIWLSIFYFNNSINKLHDNYKNKSIPLNHLQAVSNWLIKNTLPKEVIFHNRWDDFPELFYFNHQNYYINGLDQTFMYEFNDKTYKQWEKIIGLKIAPNKTGQTIKQAFKTDYILVNKKNKKFADWLKKDNSLKKVFEDYQAMIYKIN